MTTKQLAVPLTDHECGHLMGSRECDRQYSEGFEAGWRSDELVTEKLGCYMSGYEAGQTARMMHNEEMGNAKESP